MNKAYLVGIDKYKSSPLVGCANDIKDFISFLKKNCGFTCWGIRKTKNRRAKKSRIIKRLKWLLKDMKSGDNLFFFYSGHGTYIPDLNGDEVDGYDEAICPWDSVVKYDIKEDNFLIDDEFDEIFKNIPDGVKLIWISDSCHSGSLEKTIGYTDKFLVLPDRFKKPTVEDKPKNIRKSLFNSLNLVMISGCKEDQTSACDYFDNRPNGVLTYYLLKELSSSDGLNITLEELVNRATVKIKTAGYKQDPQIYGGGILKNETFFKK